MLYSTIFNKLIFDNLNILVNYITPFMYEDISACETLIYFAEIRFMQGIY